MSERVHQILDGAIASLREFALPHLKGEFDRGQLMAVMAMLAELSLRADWSREWLLEQVHEQIATFARIEALLLGSPLDRLRPPFAAISEGLSPARLESIRDEGDRYLSTLLDRVSEHVRDPALPVAELRSTILQYLKRQCECEVRLTPAAVISAR